MRPILVTQRVVVAGSGQERRDALAQDWTGFLHAAGLVAVPVPNRRDAAEALSAAVPWHGVLLTGGNDLESLGGDAAERDAVEGWLLARALSLGRPVLGVCRGMQFLLAHFGAQLVPVAGHVGSDHTVRVGDGERTVNSFHRFGCTLAPPELDVWARAPDGVLEGIRHRALPMLGLMWHPERLRPANPVDVALFARHFGATNSEDHHHNQNQGPSPCAD